MNPNKCGICGNKTSQYFFVCEECRKLSIMTRLRALINHNKLHGHHRLRGGTD